VTSTTSPSAAMFPVQTAARELRPVDDPHSPLTCSPRQPPQASISAEGMSRSSGSLPPDHRKGPRSLNLSKTQASQRPRPNSASMAKPRLAPHMMPQRPNRTTAINFLRVRQTPLGSYHPVALVSLNAACQHETPPSSRSTESDAKTKGVLHFSLSILHHSHKT
jgi:hypothetical protein